MVLCGCYFYQQSGACYYAQTSKKKETFVNETLMAYTKPNDGSRNGSNQCYYTERDGNTLSIFSCFMEKTMY